MSEEHAILTREEREERETETPVKCEPDRISRLPDEILSSIVSELTVRDAVKACLLSRRWRHVLSASMYNHHLNFDWDSMFSTHNEWYPGCVLTEGGPYIDRFVQGVNQFLQHYKCGSRLVSCRVSFYLENDSSYDIDQWVRFAVTTMGVQRLELNLSSCTQQQSHFFERRLGYMDLYILSSELFSQHNQSNKLQHLFLRSCILGPGVTGQFSCLKSLTLADVPLCQPEVESILSCCLKLESMALGNCALPFKLCISGPLPALKFFSVIDCSMVEAIELSASHLATFEYAGKMIQISFPRVPNLETVFFRPEHESGFQYVFTQLVKDLPQVKTLSVYTRHYWEPCSAQHMTTYNMVKKLEIVTLPGMMFDTQKMISILIACPLLEKFYLVKNQVKYERRMQGKIQGMQVPSSSVHKHLNEVHIGGYFDLDYIHFAIYMLEHSAALELMVLDPQLKYYIGGNHWKHLETTWVEGEREAICARLQDYCKRLRIIIK